jgi:hypothetical protein
MKGSPWPAVLGAIALVVIALEASPPLGGALLALLVVAALVQYQHTGAGLGAGS